LSVVSYYADSAHASRKLHKYFLQGDVSAGQSCVMYSAWNPKDNYDMSASVFVVRFNGFMSQISFMLSTDINITETTYSCQF
jgi:hypothetical protein